MVKNHSESPVALLFAGQGNPVIGMGADIWDLNATTKHIWDCASDITGMDVRRLCLKGPMPRLVQTTVQQVAVTAINVTLFELSTEHINKENIVGSCGHSVGEYGALYASGALTLEELFKTIHFRATLMNDLSKAHKGTMLAVKGADFEAISDLINRLGLAVDICCDNSHRQQVVGGTAADLSDFTKVLMEYGYEAVKLGVSGAWHTRLMAEGVSLMRDFLQSVEIKAPQHGVLMNVTGNAEFDPERIKENLSLHLTHTVKWRDAMVALLAHPGSVTFLEMSNKAYLGQMLADFDGFQPQAAIHCRRVIGI